MASESIVLRVPTRAELHRVAPLAAELVRMHHAFDPQRFMCLEPLEVGYEHYFAGELRNPKAVILVAEEQGAFVGYAYGRMEERDWNSLLDSCGALHDIYVVETARRRGVARRLVQELIARLEAMGAPRIVLGTAWRNVAAARFFEGFGFRRTMVEWTRERG
jgi:ribosomal protein S18 acetylase RimI-like enzyme